jgi:hypothetical protein
MGCSEPDSGGTKTTAAEVYFSLQDGLVAVEPLDPQWMPTRLEEHVTTYIRQVLFKAHVPQTFAFQTRLDQPGELRIIGGVRVLLQTEVAPDHQTLYLLVQTGGTQIQRTPFASTT